MDINERIAQRRRELEAQRVINAPIEEAIVQRAVQKNLDQLAHHEPAVSPSTLQANVDANSLPASLRSRVDEETRKAVEKVAAKSLTKADWFDVGFFVIGGIVFLPHAWWLGLALVGWGIYLFNKKVKFYAHCMMVQADSIRASREAEAAQPLPDAVNEVDGLKDAKKKPEDIA